MTSRFIFALLVTAGCLCLLNGCNGTSDINNPTITTVTVTPVQPAGTTTTTASATVPSGQVITIQVSATTTNTTANPIISTEWTEVSAVHGIINTPDALNTTWQAPIWNGPGDEPVTLTLTVRTFLGGKAVQRVNIVVTPSS